MWYTLIHRFVIFYQKSITPKCHLQAFRWECNNRPLTVATEKRSSTLQLGKQQEFCTQADTWERLAVLQHHSTSFESNLLHLYVWKIKSSHQCWRSFHLVSIFNQRRKSMLDSYFYIQELHLPELHKKQGGNLIGSGIHFLLLKASASNCLSQT